MNTILLDAVTWDLVLDDSGNIALASDPYSLAQDAASAIKTFQGEVYYDTTLGVPYWQSVLGRWPPLTLIKSFFNSAALTVPEVQSAVCYIATWADRAITGQVQISTLLGAFSAANFTTPIAGPTGLQQAPIPVVIPPANTMLPTITSSAPGSSVISSSTPGYSTTYVILLDA